MATQEIVKKGLCWHVGNGRNIRVWEDNWVPNSSTHKVLSPKGMFLLDFKVCDFIDVEKRCWDSDFLNQAFLPFEAEEISGIPLSVRLKISTFGWKLQMIFSLSKVLIGRLWS